MLLFKILVTTSNFTKISPLPQSQIDEGSCIYFPSNTSHICDVPHAGQIRTSRSTQEAHEQPQALHIQSGAGYV